MIGATWAVVVARTGPTAKSRLAEVLSPAERSALAEAMLADVLTACAAAPLAGTVAVVDTAVAAGLAAAAGAVVLADPGRGMNAAVAGGIAAAVERGAAAALVLPADVPLVRPEDIAELLGARAELGPLRRSSSHHPHPLPEGEGIALGVVVVPDRAGLGTNALLLSPPGVIAPAFGVESAPRHLGLATAAGVTTRVWQNERLALDVDRPEDLAELPQLRPGAATAAVLADLLAPARP